jgi:hypothetical protein
VALCQVRPCRAGGRRLRGSFAARLDDDLMIAARRDWLPPAIWIPKDIVHIFSCAEYNFHVSPLFALIYLAVDLTLMTHRQQLHFLDYIYV